MKANKKKTTSREEKLMIGSAKGGKTAKLQT
jgi:hypothetical protein